MQMKMISKCPPAKAGEIPWELWVPPGLREPEMALQLQQFGPLLYFKNSGKVVSAERSFLCAI